MRIGINLLPFRKNLTGTGVYAYNIINEFQKMDLENEYFLFTNKENNDVFNCVSSNFKKVELPFFAQNFILRIFWEQLIFPFYLKKHQIDLLFSPSVVLPVLSKCKNVICVHDLIPFHIKKKYSRLRSFYIRLMTQKSTKKADAVLTVSLNSKKELQKYCNISSKKITVTYNGVNNALLNPNKSNWEIFKKENRIPEKYIIFLGTLEPGKNLNVLIKAFKLLVVNYKIAHKLVIAGGKGWLFENIFCEVKRLKLENRVIFPDYVPNDVLGFLYKKADVFVLPSLYEGFGIPVLEAMNFGTPVIVSNTSSLPEVVENAGKLIDPHNDKELAKTIYDVLTNYELRNGMIKNGYKQASKFSWKNSAQIALNEFHKFR